MAMQTPSEHRADARAGRNAIWVIVACIVILAIAMIGVVGFYYQWFAL